ncbi:hypothetical protein E8E14_001865 [Neopestalotiopsis sp. 37M]|nr:hypothetical protein E8E14_001865 [Neopestalotiopsis sp. 37M]
MNRLFKSCGFVTSDRQLYKNVEVVKQDDDWSGGLRCYAICHELMQMITRAHTAGQDAILFDEPVCQWFHAESVREEMTGLCAAMCVRELGKGARMAIELVAEPELPEVEPGPAMKREPPKQENLFGNFGSADMQPEHIAAMALGIISTGSRPIHQPPSGTNYPPLDLGIRDMGSGLSPNVFQRDLAGGTNHSASPLPMFSNLENSGDMMRDQNFDGVVAPSVSPLSERSTTIEPEDREGTKKLYS